jgi:large repetitive protein
VTAFNTSGRITEPYSLTVVQDPTFNKDKDFCPSTLTVGTYVHLDQYVVDWPPFFGLTTTGQLPTGLQFIQNTTAVSGVLSGTPVAADAGKKILKYSADNTDTGVTRYDHCKVTIDDAPSFTGSGFAAVTDGVHIYPPISIGGDPGWPRTRTVSATLPEPVPGITLTPHSGKTFAARLSGKPVVEPEGDYLVDVQVKNTVATVTEEFVLVVKPSGSTRKPTTVTLTAPAVTTSFTHGVTLTATVNGNSPDGGYVQFLVQGADAPVTVPVTKTGTKWVASYTTPSAILGGVYNVTATYTGNATTASSTAVTVLDVTGAPTSLALSPSAQSVSTATEALFTARVTSPVGTPQGEVVFSLDTKEVGADLDSTGVATFTPTPTLATSLDTSKDPYTVHAQYMPYEDAPPNWLDSTATATLTVGAVTLSADASSSPQTVVAIPAGGTVTVTPSMPLEISVHLSTGGAPPAPVTIATVATATTYDAPLGLTPSETEPSSDPNTGKTDFFWSIPQGKLTTLAVHSVTVTIDSSASDEDLPASFSFTLTW